MDYKKLAGKRIRQARKDAGFKSCKALARALNVEYERLSMYERGHRYVDPDIAVQIGKLFGMDPGYLMGITDNPGYTKEEQSLIEIYRGTDERGRKHIRHVAEIQPASEAGPVNSQGDAKSA